MNIGINGYEAVVPRFGYNKQGLPNRVGSSEFCYQLLVHLSKIDKSNNYFIYLPQNPTPDMPSETENWKYKIIRAKKAWTLTSLSFELLKKQSKIDVFFSPTHYLPISAPAKSVISILDVSYLHFPNLFAKKDLYQLKLWGGFSIKRAKKILTISSSSKNDIIKGYGLPSEKVAVVYPGIKKISNIKYPSNSAGRQISNMDELQKKFGIEGKFILFVGTLQPRKNIVRLIEAFAKLKRNDLDLVIIGKKGWQYEEILAAPEKFGVGDRVKFLDSVSNEELPSFYQHAQFFILPSLYEGFGLPVLEAMNYGCPVITSDVSSLPEAGGDAALYVDPKNVQDIYEKMKKLLSDDDLKKELIEKGYKQAKKFSWEKSARQTLAVLEEVAKT
ncbi:MAG: glycosyltransferase family 4 protein [Candidatus Levybacteria bacterium]|nr:glycosyltransferase family 4 protein [Candidatus Levybacteria bacterium]